MLLKVQDDSGADGSPAQIAAAGSRYDAEPFVVRKPQRVQDILLVFRLDHQCGYDPVNTHITAESFQGVDICMQIAADFQIVYIHSAT